MPSTPGPQEARLNPRQRYRPKEPIIGWRKIEALFLVVNMDCGSCFVLQGTAARIWELLSPENTVHEIAGALLSAYSVEKEQVLSDTEHFLAQLLQRGLIEEAP